MAFLYMQGYCRQLHYRSLSKCTALTGAGGLDALSLSMSDAISMRFWLEMLNLSWGDFIIFKRCHSSLIKSMAKRLARCVGREGHWTKFFHRLPSLIFLLVASLSMEIGWLLKGKVPCAQVKSLCGGSLALFGAL